MVIFATGACADIACIDNPRGMLEAVFARLVVDDNDQPAIMSCLGRRHMHGFVEAMRRRQRKRLWGASAPS